MKIQNGGIDKSPHGWKTDSNGRQMNCQDGRTCRRTIVEKIGLLGTFVSTNLNLTPEEMIEGYSKRISIEEMFKDLKEICGLVKQQLRNFESNLACFPY